MFKYNRDECTLELEDCSEFVKENPSFIVKSFKYKKSGQRCSYKEHKIDIDNIKAIYNSSSKSIAIKYNNGKIRHFDTTEIFNEIYDEVKETGRSSTNLYLLSPNECLSNSEVQSVFTFRMISMDDFNKIRMLAELYGICEYY